uniref:Major tropism determinant N-terminal domain-containing protein n=1 Tax=viral metagenome TaxID=1070528 RepID=A0A6M3M3M0_9ZZZZ
MSRLKEYKHTVPMTNDTTWTSAIPAGYELEKIIFVNSTANAATLDLGTSSGAEDVFEQQVIAASGITTVVINKTFSMLTRQSLYLNDDGAGTWNSTSLTAILLMRRVMI